jgi:hypothetical protein
MPEAEFRDIGSYALLIATGRYDDPGLARLRSPTRDAEELARVLEDPAIGGFRVQTLVDEPHYRITDEIEGFFTDRHFDDLLVLYFSGHGIKGPGGGLYFAAPTTKLNRLDSTGIPETFLYAQVEKCRSRRILLLLDCCYSGAYLKGHRPRAGEHVTIGLPAGRGRAVITSSGATQYSFEIDTGEVTGSTEPSVFTEALVAGLSTGEADSNGDGFVSVGELYAYVYDRVRARTPHQIPQLKCSDIQGDLVIAKNPHPPSPDPEALSGAIVSAPALVPEMPARPAADQSSRSSPTDSASARQDPDHSGTASASAARVGLAGAALAGAVEAGTAAAAGAGTVWKFLGTAIRRPHDGDQDRDG